MTLNRPLIIVDDDADDQDMIQLALEELGITGEIKSFRDAESALSYLQKNQSPFLIISDINMPKMDGFRFKESIENCEILSEKKIPFVFLSTSSNDSYIRRAYHICAQGFFEKGASFMQLKESLATILRYWYRTKTMN